MRCLLVRRLRFASGNNTCMIKSVNGRKVVTETRHYRDLCWRGRHYRSLYVEKGWKRKKQTKEGGRSCKSPGSLLSQSCTGMHRNVLSPSPLWRLHSPRARVFSREFSKLDSTPWLKQRSSLRSLQPLQLKNTVGRTDWTTFFPPKYSLL